MLDYDTVRSKVLSEMKRLFNPELVNRFDEAIVFRSLTPDDIKKIIDILMGRMNQRLAERNIRVDLSEPARAMLIETGYDSEYGARPLRRALQTHVEDPLSSLILENKVKDGDHVLAVLNERGDIIFEIAPREPALAAAEGAEPLIGSAASQDE